MKTIQGISVRLPLVYGTQDGPYILNKDVGEVVRQNFKNLLLTNPGERVMMPQFGVGLTGLLFEQMVPTTYDMINARIHEQVRRYMPFINLESIDYGTFENNPNIPLNQVNVSITYNLGDLSSSDKLTITSLTS
jgi:phage baseplate assembly protein W